MSKKWIYRFEELGQEFNDLVGKKCANLGEMTRMGLRVPPGFALTVDAYKEFMHASRASEEITAHLSKVGEDLESIKQLNQTSADLREIVESKRLPREMHETILSHYQEVCQKCEISETPVSTRSAGTASHPGQYETYLNVRGETDLIENIIKVWSSTFNARSLSARKRAGVSLETMKQIDSQLMMRNYEGFLK